MKLGQILTSLTFVVLVAAITVTTSVGLPANATAAQVESSRHGITVVVGDRWQRNQYGDKEKFVFANFRDKKGTTNVWWILSKSRRPGEDFPAWQKRQAGKVAQAWGGANHKCRIQVSDVMTQVTVSGVNARQTSATMTCGALTPKVVYVAYQVQGGKYWAFMAFYPAGNKPAPEEDQVNTILSGVQLTR